MIRFQPHLIVALGLSCLIWLPSSARAQAFDLSWNSIDGGGLTNSQGGGWSLGGTIGQLDAGVTLSGAGWECAGGFWSNANAPGPSLPGDLDADCDVDLSDLTVLLAHFGTPTGALLGDGDSDADGDVDLSDLTLLLADFGATCP